MTKLKTIINNTSVTEFIDSVPNERKRNDASGLLKIFKDTTGEKPIMRGANIIGFGQYHYVYKP